LFPRLVGFAIIIFIGRSLGPQGFGAFSLAYSWVHFCWGAVDLGTSNYALRLLAEDHTSRQKHLAEIFGLNATLALVTLTLAAAAAWFLIGDSVLKLTVLAMLLFLPAFAAYPDWYLRGTGALKRLAIGNFAVASAWLAGTILLQRPPQPARFGLAWALSPLAGSLAFWIGIPDKRFILRDGLRPLAWLTHLRISGLFALSGAISNATIPAMLSALGLIAGFGVLGSYTLGLRLGMMGAGALLIVLQNLLPQLVQLRKEVSPNRIVAAPLSLAIIGFGSLVTLSPFVLIPLVGRSYRPGLFWILLGAAVIIPWSIKLPIEFLLIANRLDWERILVQLISLLGVLVSGAVMWLSHAAVILPIGYLVSECAGSYVGWILLRRSRQV
jgi:O-antigen/teichoic acid export membrane protein